MYNHKTGKIQKMDIEEYLCGVLSGEMPSDFNIEALKAKLLQLGLMQCIIKKMNHLNIKIAQYVLIILIAKNIKLNKN